MTRAQASADPLRALPLFIRNGTDLIAYLRPLLRPPEDVYAEASENRQFNVLYLLMLVLSCLISLLGLLLNSRL